MKYNEIKDKGAISSRDALMPVWDEKHLRAATQAAGVALWSWNVDTDAITMDEHAYNLWEVSKDEQKITLKSCHRISTLPIWRGSGRHSPPRAQ